MANTLHEALDDPNAIAAISYNTQSDDHIAVVAKTRGSNTQVVVSFFKHTSTPTWIRDDNFYAALPNIGTVTSPPQRFIFNILDLESLLALTANGGYTVFYAIKTDGT